MKFLPKKTYLLTSLLVVFFFVGVSFKNDFFEIAKQIEIFTTTFKTVNMNYVDEINPAQLMDKALKTMLEELDPYTVYYNEADVVKAKINSFGEYPGIGALINRTDGKVILTEIIKNYGADKAGLKAGDEITHIGDIKLEDYKDDTSNLLSGVKGTKIDIKYKRQNKTYNAQITIDPIETKAVPFFGKINDNTGYIALKQFYASAARETQSALEELKNQGATQIILDLRGNPGGLTDQAVNICNLFVEQDQVIAFTKSKVDKNNTIYKTRFKPIDIEIPLVILIDQKSASSSEIVSGALQDLDRAVIVGTRSFGKGLVQRPIELTYGTQVKVTISRYYMPSGRCIQSLDYTHRDNQGNATKTNIYKEFKTRKGRIVYDGSGIQPDIELEETKKNPISQALIEANAIFNYATNYYYKHPDLGNKIPNITDSDFNDFKNWLKQEKFSYNTQTQKALEKTLEVAKKEQIDKNIQTQYQALLQAIAKSNQTELDKNKDEIKRLLVEELILRYKYREGLYDYYLSTPEIQKSVQILNDKNQYNKILKK